TACASSCARREAKKITAVHRPAAQYTAQPRPGCVSGRRPWDRPNAMRPKMNRTLQCTPTRTPAIRPSTNVARTALSPVSLVGLFSVGLFSLGRRFPWSTGGQPFCRYTLGPTAPRAGGVEDRRRTGLAPACRARPLDPPAREPALRGRYGSAWMADPGRCDQQMAATATAPVPAQGPRGLKRRTEATALRATSWSRHRATRPGGDHRFPRAPPAGHDDAADPG